MTKNFYVTSPIYYVNDVPHIGHAYTSIACDVAARFHRQNGDNVYFLTGTDEHGQKVEKSALGKGIAPQEFCDNVSQKFRELGEVLQLSNDDFIRTTQERHKICAQEIWQQLEKNGFIYKGVYEGWYAIRDEAFYTEDEIVDGKAPSGAEVTWEKQESYFFKLSAFGEKLLTLYDTTPDFVRPKSKMNEVRSFVKSGLRDLSISRNTFSWGVKVPNDEKHIMYVWLDALTNYLSALGFASPDLGLYEKFWQNTTNSPIHIVGKDILRFHAIYWPAFLMAADLPLPYGIFAHGWWTNEGQKISKSTGNVIDPLAEIEWLKNSGCDENCALDYFRYFLMREIPFGGDGDYSRGRFVERVNSELANNIGNLAQRSLSMIYKNNGGEIVDFSDFETGFEGGFEVGNPLAKIAEMREVFARKMHDFAYDEAIFAVINFASICNQFINDEAPWKLKKAGEMKKMNQILSIVAKSLAEICDLLKPFLPNLCQKLELILTNDGEFDLCEFGAGKNIGEPRAIFPRLES